MPLPWRNTAARAPRVEWRTSQTTIRSGCSLLSLLVLLMRNQGSVPEAFKRAHLLPLESSEIFRAQQLIVVLGLHVRSQAGVPEQSIHRPPPVLMIPPRSSSASLYTQSRYSTGEWCRPATESGKKAEKATESEILCNLTGAIAGKHEWLCQSLRGQLHELSVCQFPVQKQDSPRFQHNTSYQMLNRIVNSSLPSKEVEILYTQIFSLKVLSVMLDIWSGAINGLIKYNILKYGISLLVRSAWIPWPVTKKKRHYTSTYPDLGIHSANVQQSSDIFSTLELKNFLPLINK